MDEKNLRSILEEMGEDLTPEQIEEILQALKPLKPVDTTSFSSVVPADQITMLEIEAEKESDWRRKAALRAKIISLRLEA